MLIFAVGNCVPSPTCFVEGHSTQPGERAGSAGMPEAYTQVHAFCRLVGHYRGFIKGFANIACPLYDVLGKEVKMGPVDLPPKAQEAVAILKGKVQSVPVLVFPDFEKPFLLETDASKEGLGVVLSQKQGDRWYHPVAFGSHSLTPVEKNYHSFKL